MTPELPPRQSDPQTDATAHPGNLESLGFTFGEESPATQPVDVPFPPAAPSAPTASAAPLSRRALREAEKQANSRRRGRGASRPAAVEPDAVSSSSDPAEIATAPFTAVEHTAPSVSSPPAPESVVHPAAGRARRSGSGRAVLRRPPVSAPAVPAPPSAAPTVSLRRRVAQKTFPPVVMAAAAALLIGTSVPPSALFDPDAPPASAAFASIPTKEVESSDGGEVLAAPELDEGQVLEMALTEDVAAPIASRDDWSVTSYAEMLRLRYGTRDFSYSTTGTGAVRWPFPFAAPISSGFGERVAPCRGCSSYHQGLDFTPGRGSPIYSVADGVVVQADQYGGFGTHVLIDHVINGQKVTSVYAHMVRDSSPLVAGDTIAAGEFIGLVGSTGASTGAHLHLEIRIDGIAIDPFAWLTTNAS